MYTPHDRKTPLKRSAYFDGDKQGRILINYLSKPFTWLCIKFTYASRLNTSKEILTWKLLVIKYQFRTICPLVRRGDQKKLHLWHFIGYAMFYYKDMYILHLPNLFQSHIIQSSMFRFRPSAMSRQVIWNVSDSPRSRCRNWVGERMLVLSTVTTLMMYQPNRMRRTRWKSMSVLWS